MFQIRMNTKVYITYYKEYTTSDTEAEREELKTLRRSLEAQLETAENAKVQDESDIADIETRLDIARDRLKEIGKTLRGANKTRQAVTRNRPVPSHYGTFRSITKNF